MSNYIVSSGVTSSGIILQNYDSMTVLNGGIAKSTMLNSIGIMFVSSGGLVYNAMVNSYGYIYISSGGIANDTTVTGGYLSIEGNAEASNTTVNDGLFNVDADGIAYDTVINRGQFKLNGVVSNVTISSNGNLRVLSNGVLTGRIFVEEGVSCYFANGGCVDFNISNLSEGSTALLNNISPFLSLSYPSPNYTITVSDSQSQGIYRLAENASGYIKPFSVQNTSGELLDTIAVESMKCLNGLNYILEVVDETLILTVSDKATYFNRVVSGGESTIASDNEIYIKARINSGGSLYISSGGEAIRTTINSHGKVDICSGGTANSTTIFSKGLMQVLFGGVTDNTVVSGGSLYISSGGTANGVVWTPCEGDIAIEGGAYVTFASQYSGVYLGKDGKLLSSAATMEFKTLEHSGEMYVMHDGITTSAMVQSDGKLVVSGGTANSTTVSTAKRTSRSVVQQMSSSFSGGMYVFSHGEANYTLVNGGGMYVSGGVANNTTIDNGSISSYATYNNDENNSLGGIHVFFDGVANNTTINNGGMYIAFGGTANNTTLNSGFVYSSSYFVLSKTVSSGGIHVSEGGIANKTIINGGDMYVSAGGTATAITVNNGGLYISSGGTAVEIKENGGYVNVADGAIASFVTNELSGLMVSTALSVHSCTTVNNATIQVGGGIHVFSAGIVNQTLVFGGQLFVSSGGSVFNVVVSTGRLNVCSSGIVNDVTVSGGSMFVSSGGTADAVSVNIGGRINVLSGGTAIEIAENGGFVEFEDNANIAFASTTLSGLVITAAATIHSGTTANNTTAIYGGDLAVYSDGIVNSTIIKDGNYYGGAKLTVYSGGIANITTVVSQGRMLVSSGGTADSTTVDSGGNLYVLGTVENTVVNAGFMYLSSGGFANNITVNDGGIVHILSNGTVTAISENGGFVDFEDGANITFVANTFSGQVLSNTATVHSGTTANHTELNFGGNMHVFSGGFASRTTVFEGGNLFVSSGGTATEIAENGGYVEIVDGGTAVFVTNTFSGLVLSNASTTVHSGTTADSIAVQKGGKLFLYSGGKVTGTTFIADGATVSAFGGAILDFNISILSSGEPALINNLSAVSGWENIDYTLTVSDMQTSGTYVLAEGATSFNRTITVQDSLGNSLNTLSVGQIKQIGEEKYSLNLANGVLSLTVKTPVIGLTISDETQVVSAYEIYRETTVDSGGRFYISSGGLATATMVNPGGTLYIDAGGTATGIVENGGYVAGGYNIHYNDSIISPEMIFAPHVFSGLILSNASATVHSGTTATDTTIDTGYMTVFSGGIAQRISVTPGGKLYIDAGGTATEVMENGGYVEIENGANISFVPNTFSGQVLSDAATVHSGTTAIENTVKNGEVYVSSGGTTINTEIDKDGYLYVSSGGVASDVSVKPDGYLHVLSGGTATNIFWTPCEGTVSIDSDGLATFASQYSGVYLGSSGKMVSNTAIMDAKMLGCKYESGYSNGQYYYTSSAGDGELMYVMSGGLANNTAIHDEGNLYVSSGGTANNTKINDWGFLYVSSGGMAYNTTINTCDGGMYVSFGGIADNTVINVSNDDEADGYIGGLFVLSGGMANSTTVNSGGKLSVSSGGIATDIVWTPCEGYIIVEDGAYASFASQYFGVYLGLDGTLVSSATVMNAKKIGFDYYASDMYAGDIMYVMSGGVVESTTAVDGGVYVWSGGTANSTTISDGRMEVSSGGVANNTVIKSSYWDEEDFYHYDGLTVFSGGTVNATVLSGGLLDVSSGGTANNTTVRGGEKTNGALFVSSGGRAYSVTVNEGGYLFVSSGGTAMEIDWNPEYGGVSFEDGAQVTFTGNYSGVYFRTGSSTARIHENTVDAQEYDGIMYVMSDGVANNIALMEERSLFVFSGGTADRANVSFGGTLLIGSGGTATNVIWTPCEGHVAVCEGASVLFASQYSGVYLGNGYQLCSHTTTLESAIVGLRDEDGEGENEAYVMSGGVVSDMTINGGALYVWSGGIANDTDLSGRFCSGDDGPYYISAYLTVSSHGTANRTSVNSDGDMNIRFGGTANSTTVYADGIFRVASGGTAMDTVVSGGSLYVSSGGTATGIVWNPCEGYITIEDGAYVTFASQYSGVYYGKDKKLLSSAVAMDDKILDLGYEMHVTTNGTANSTTVNCGGKMNVSSGGTANAVEINRYGHLDVVSGGIVDNVTVNSNGSIVISSGGTVNGAVINTGGQLFINSGAALNGATLNSGIELVVFSGTMVNKTIVKSDAGIKVSSGAQVNSTMVYGNGYLNVSSGGITSNTRVYAGGTLRVIGGAKLAGQMNFAAGAVIFVENGVIVDFDLTQTVAGGKALLTDWSLLQGTPDYILTVNDNQANGVYALADGAEDFDGTITVQNSLGESFGTLTVGQKLETEYAEYILKVANGSLTITINPVIMVSDVMPQTQTWTKNGEDTSYTVEYSLDNFEHVIQFMVDSNSLDSFQMPAGNYQMRVKPVDGEWTVVDSVVATEEVDNEPKFIKSNADGNADVFFANAIGTWESGYIAQHVGSINDWGGTNEYTAVFGKNKLADIIEGSTDANILLMTDDSNGDALFVDDIYTALPGSIAEQQARIALIDEIRAGAGADIVDMTSQRFEYIGDGLTIRGGEGNDTIWANKGSNFLFGDAGNDRIVGASGNDVIVGGIGNDHMHGGGGNDVFTFCDNWGVDSVEQLASGSVTLWFASEEKGIWDASSLTYTDGENSVKVTGVTADKITLMFGDDGSVQFATLSGMGAFFDATTERIFEESGKGILASL